MSTTHSGLTFKRFTRQVRTEMTAVLATSAAAHQAETLLKSAPWVEQTDTQGTFPARNALQDGFSGTWEAFKHVGNYSAGYQRAYAGMVAYRFQLPADASGKDVVSVDVPLYVDRWLVDGVRVAAYLSDDTTPATAWDTLRAGDANEDAQLPMTYTEDDPPQRVVVEKNDTITVTFPGSTAAADYLWVIISLEDYTTSRDFWIEGAALILGEAVKATFSAAVTADAVIALPPTEREIVETRYVAVSPSTWAPMNFSLSLTVDDATAGPLVGITGFPVAQSGTEAQFAGATGALVGYSGTTNDLFYGVILPRIFHLSENETYTRMRFSAASVFPLAAKEFSARMIVWAGDVTVPNDTPASVTAALVARPRNSDVGYRQQELFRGYTGAATVANAHNLELQTPWEVAKIGECVLEGKNYTNQDTFDIALSGAGVKVILVCVSMERYWAASAGAMATANAKFTPGSSIYLS
jgi:hypothetical protein